MMWRQNKPPTNNTLAIEQLWKTRNETIKRLEDLEIVAKSVDPSINPTSLNTSGNGVVVQIAATTYAARTITGSASKITVINGSGVSGNPTITIPDAVILVNLTATDITIGANTVDTNEWAFLDGLNQSVSTGDSPTFAGLTLTGFAGAVSATAGVLAAGTLSVPYGGTGTTTLTDGGLLLGSGVGAITPLGQATNGQLPIGSTGADPALATLTGTANQITVTNGAGSITISIPAAVTLTNLTVTDITIGGNTVDTNEWANLDGLDQTVATGSSPTFAALTLSSPLTVPNGGSGVNTLTDHGILLGSGAGAITPLGVAGNGEIPIGSAGADPVVAGITGTANQITVTNGAGSITLSAPQNLHTAATFQVATLGVGMAATGTIQSGTSNAVNYTYLDTYDDGASYSHLRLRKSDTDVIGNTAQTDNADYLGALSFWGVNNTGPTWATGASITAQQDGVANITVPTNLIFETWNAVAGQNANQLVLHNDGASGFGTVTPGTNVHIYENAASTVPQLLIEQAHAAGDSGMRWLTQDGTTFSAGIDITDSLFKINSGATVGAAHHYSMNASGITLMNLVETTSSTLGVVNRGGNRWMHSWSSPGDDGFNVFIGNLAGNFTMSRGGGATYLASNNVGIGSSALTALTTGYRNLAIGGESLLKATTAFNCVAIGTFALRENLIGTANVAIGTGALRNNTADHNVAIGSQALLTNTVGTFNVALGSISLFTNLSGSHNMAIGYGTLYANSIGSRNVAIGSSVLAVTTASDNTGVGYFVLNEVVTGTRNTAVGQQALRYNMGDDNTALGDLACNYVSLLNVAHHRNTGVGSGALFTGYDGDNNTGLGYRAGYSAAIVDGGVYLGAYAGYYETAGDSLYIDNRGRTNLATGRISALVYGLFSATVANQLFRVNGSLEVNVGDCFFTGTGAGLLEGSCYMNHPDPMWTQAAVQNTWYNISHADFSSGPLLNSVTHDGSGKLTAPIAGKYRVHYCVCFECSVANKHIETGIELNNTGTAEAQGQAHIHAVSPNAEYSLTCHADVDLAAGEFVEVAIQTVDVGNPNISVHGVNFSIEQIGGT